MLLNLDYSSLLKKYFKNFVVDNSNNLYNTLINNNVFFYNIFYRKIYLLIIYIYYIFKNKGNNKNLYVKTISINLNEINFNFLNLFYKNKNDIKYFDKFEYCCYGINLLSADGEAYLQFIKKNFLFNFLKIEYIENVIDKIYNILISENFFIINKIIILENNMVTNNIFYYRFFCYLFYKYCLLFVEDNFPNNINENFQLFFRKNKKIIKFLKNELNDYVKNKNYSIREIIQPFDRINLPLMESSKKQIITIQDIINYKIKYEKILTYDIRYICKIIPIDLKNKTFDEIKFLYNINKLMLNGICEDNLGIFIDYFIIDDYKYNNPNIVQKYNNNNEYIKIKNIILNINQDNENNNKTNTSFIYNVKNIISNLNENIYQKKNYIIIQEYKGRTLYDIPFYIYHSKHYYYHFNKNIISYDKGDIDTNLYMINKIYEFLDLFFLNISVNIFYLIYTLLCLNKKIKIIHGDLHLNNITVSVKNVTRNSPQNNQLLKKLIYYDKKFTKKDLYEIFRNNLVKLVILKNNNITNNTFVIPADFADLCVIDFSRAINLNNKYESSEKLIQLFLTIFPEYQKNKEFMKNLTNASILQTEILFNILSGYDIYYVLDYLIGLFKHFNNNKSNLFPKQSKININFLNKMKNYLKITMLKNTKKLLKNILKSYITNTNELLLYKFFSKYLLKNYNKNDFINLNDCNINKFDKLNKTIFNEIEEKMILDNKKFIINILNINNELKINDVEELLHYLI